MCVGLCVSFSAGLTSFHLKISFLGCSLTRHGVQKLREHLREESSWFSDSGYTAA